MSDQVAYRPAATADWAALAAVVNAARKADSADEIYSAGSLASDYPGVEMERDGVVAEVAGEVVGYCIGQLRERDGVLVADLTGAVHPARRRRGIGSQLLHEARDRAAARMAGDPRTMPHELRSYAMDSETGLVAMLEDEGFVPIRFGYEMRRFLTGALPDRSMPPGLEIRPVAEADHRRIFDAGEEAFQDHWGHRPATEQDFHDLFHGADMTPELWCVAWDGEEVAGVVVNTIHPDEVDGLGIRRGWLNRVSVRRPWRGRGLAKALCAESMRVLRARGMEEAWLGVDGLNPSGAVHLYEGLGFHVAKGWKAFGRPVDAPAPRGWRTAGDRETIGA